MEFSDRQKLCDVEKILEFHKWLQLIPYIKYPASWLVQTSPNFGGSVVRFRVKKANQKNPDNSISVYLDCYGILGCMDYPYWEVYPVDNDTARFKMEDTEGLIKAISKGLRQL